MTCFRHIEHEAVFMDRHPKSLVEMFSTARLVLLLDWDEQIYPGEHLPSSSQFLSNLGSSIHEFLLLKKEVMTKSLKHDWEISVPPLPETMNWQNPDEMVFFSNPRYIKWESDVQKQVGLVSILEREATAVTLEKLEWQARPMRF